MILNYQEQDIQLDTLYSGCTIGQYGALSNIQQPFTAKVKKPTMILTLDAKEVFDNLDKNPALRLVINAAKKYIKESGVPLVDYTLYRSSKKKN